MPRGKLRYASLSKKTCLKSTARHMRWPHIALRPCRRCWEAGPDSLSTEARYIRVRGTNSSDIFLEGRSYPCSPVESSLCNVVVQLPGFQLVPEPTKLATHEKLQPFHCRLCDHRVPSLRAIPFAASAVVIEVAVIIVIVLVIGGNCDARSQQLLDASEERGIKGDGSWLAVVRGGTCSSLLSPLDILHVNEGCKCNVSAHE